MTFTADAIENAELSESGNELTIVAPIEWKLALSEADINKGLVALGVGLRRIKIVTGAVKTPPKPERSPKLDDEVAGRALANPDVQRFQQAFPESQVRKVQDLKD